jgi:hypothetical protein
MINNKFVAIVLVASILAIISIAAGQGLDASGKWKQTTQGLSESSIWDITWDQNSGLWKAKESGLGGAEGTATLTNNVLIIKWTTPNNWAGYYEWTLDPTGTSGTGKLVWTKKYGNQVSETLTPSTVTRISGPCSLQVNGQGLDPQTSKYFLVSGIYSGPDGTQIRIVYSTDSGAKDMPSPSTIAYADSIYNIETTILPGITKLVNYHFEYKDKAAGIWRSCGNTYTWQESYL